MEINVILKDTCDETILGLKNADIEDEIMIVICIRDESYTAQVRLDELELGIRKIKAT